MGNVRFVCHLADQLRGTCRSRGTESRCVIGRGTNALSLGFERVLHIGEWVLVTAAAGGVGIAAVQIAKGALSCILVIHANI